MAGNYKVITSDGENIGGECFVLRIQDRCAARAIAAYCQAVYDEAILLAAGAYHAAPSPKQKQAVRLIESLGAHGAACRDILRQFQEFGPTKLPD